MSGSGSGLGCGEREWKEAGGKGQEHDHRAPGLLSDGVWALLRGDGPDSRGERTAQL